MLLFMRLVQEVLNDKDITSSGDFRIQAATIAVLQTAAEAYLVSHFEDVGLCAIHGKCITVMPKDTHLAMHIQRDKVTGWDIESSAQLSGAK